MVQNSTVASAIIAIAASCLLSVPDVTMAAEKHEEGFARLFDGKTLDGWHLMNGAKFVVEDGVLKHRGGLGWLRSEQQYSDFVFRLEFRFLKPKQDGGVFVRSNTEGDNWPNRKYEVQIENTVRMAKIFGAEHDLNAELAQKALKPTGEWNEYEIKLIRSKIEVRLNGELVSQSNEMNGLKRGYIGLQGENGAHEYRKLRIKDLSGEDDGFKPIFDGKTLKGWKAPNMTYWSVEDGAITAESAEENPCTSNQFLVWQGGDVADFELKVKFRLANNNGNSGIQFRSKIDNRGMGIGYQADILPGGSWCGALCDEYTGRETLMVPNGHKTVVDADGKRTCTPAGKPVSLRKAGEWNDYHIVARGHHMILKINGQVSAEFIDNDEKEFDASGILALQLRSGPFMKVQFKEILLKQIR